MITQIGTLVYDDEYNSFFLNIQGVHHSLDLTDALMQCILAHLGTTEPEHCESNRQIIARLQKLVEQG